jgi:uncharacterized protein (TIGR02246 family)
MSTREVVNRYYEFANLGDWEAWTDLFAENLVMDEQLGGHVEGRTALRAMMRGFHSVYTAFHNRPKHIVVDGDEAAVVSHISATTRTFETIEADVVNYFRVVGGRIAYLANFHDTVPFLVLAST